MKPVKSPIKGGDNNSNVIELKAALQFLIEKEKIGFNANERAAIIAGLNREQGYKDFTIKVVTTFQEGQRITPSGEVDETTAKAINALLKELGALDDVDDTANGIQGYVYMDVGVPANNITLRMYSKGFGGKDVLVASGNTAASGNYKLTYDAANLPSANLEVRAVDAQGKEHVLSATLFNSEKIPASFTLNLIAPSTITTVGDTEFARLGRDLAGIVGNINNLVEAKEQGERQDITLLSQNTNWDARAIALASLAGNISKATQLSHEAAYALLRAGLPADPDQFAQLNAEDINKALELATKSGIVNINDDQRKTAVTAFTNYANTTRLNTRDLNSISTYADFLNNEGLTKEQQLAFAGVFFKPRKNATEFWEQVKAAGIGDDTIKKLQLQGKLAYLTSNNAPLAKDLQANINGADDLSKLVSDELYEADAWDARLKAIAGTNDDNAEAIGKLIPDSYVGGTVAERKQAYTNDMAEKVRVAFPEKVLRNRIETKKVVLGDDATQANTVRFLTNAEGPGLGFKLGVTHIDSFAEKNKDSLFQGMSDADKTAAVEGMKTLQRVHQLTPDDEAMQVLLDLGHKSAQDVISVQRDQFIDQFEKKYLEKYKERYPGYGRQIGRIVYNKSHQVHSVTYSFFTAVKQTQYTPPVFAMSGDADKRAKEKQELADKIKGFANLEQLFGSLDFCGCEHCRSVLSPAAYLVDLLQYLDRNETDWAYFLDKWKQDHNNEDYTTKYTKPYDALMARRPDIGNLPLTCENTNTAMPYIDIVNEILEYFLVNKTITEEVAHDTGTATTPELLAEPQNIEPKAYDLLKKAIYPLTLPFDLWIEMVRGFCNQYDTSLHQVLKTLQPLTGPDFAASTKITVESLGIAPAEYVVLVNENALDTLAGLYGFPDEVVMITGLQSAKQLSNRLGITYKELVELVQTKFINPRLNELTLLQKMAVNVNDVFRYKNAAGFTPFTADELKAFEDKLDAATQLYGVNAKAAIDTAWNSNVFRDVLLLNDTNAACNFDTTTVGYADRNAIKFDWLRFNLFVRLWRKLGQPMNEVDRMLDVFMPAALRAIVHDNTQTEADRAKSLAAALGNALINIAHLQTLTTKVNAGKQARIKLSTLWATIPATGKNPLYAQLFLSRNVLKIDDVFDDLLGQYLQKDLQIVESQKDHTLALQAALNLTAGDIAQILKENGLDIATAKLTMQNVSLLYRYGLLAKGLKLTVTELITLKQLSGLDPFTPLPANGFSNNDNDIIYNQTLKFVTWAEKIKASGFKIEDLDYLFNHRFDAAGKYRLVKDTAVSTTKALAGAISLIQTEHAIPGNPADPTDLTPFASFTDAVLQQKLALAIPAPMVGLFFGMWTNQQPKDWNLVKDGLQAFLQEAQFDALFIADAPDADDITKQQNGLQKRSVLAKAILPYIQQKLIKQVVAEIITNATGATRTRVEWLISDAARLHDKAQPAISLGETFAKATDASEAENIQRAFTLLSKVQQLAQGFAWSDLELQYIITHGKDFGDLVINNIPVAENAPLADGQPLFKAFISLCNYTNTRNELAGGGEDLINLFDKAGIFYDAGVDEATTKTAHLDALYQQLATLTRRDKALVKEAAELLGVTAAAQPLDGQLFINVAALASEPGPGRLWELLKLLQVFGISLKALSDVASIIATGLPDEKYQAIAQDLKNAVKARYEVEAWQQIAQPVFDKLRQRRRDALVAYLLHNYSNLFTSLEEMYEYFLIDPGTEPVVQTSRIRIATASIQLFIQRCLLNLEGRWDKKVPPGAINVRFWQWMNQYRVWEANRKIFLFPENWLEPEWRDDKTFLFRELEGKLLQGDVSNELVEEAFFSYLQKLEEIARLEIVTMYCEEDPITPQSNKLHVIGRTYSFQHKYYYRTYASGEWTPWEPIDAEIEGDHIVTIMWRGRLHLFWVTFLEKVPPETKPAGPQDNNLKLADWPVNTALSAVSSGPATKKIEAYLHWSELYQGKWSTRKSGGLDKPVAKNVSISTSTRNIRIYVTKEATNPVYSDLDGAVHINLPELGGAFSVVNKNCPPEILTTADTPVAWPYQKNLSINRLPGNGDLKVQFLHYLKTLNGSAMVRDLNPQTILDASAGAYNLVPSGNVASMGGAEIGPLITPFFYQDSWHTFYVQPTITETVTIDEWDEWIYKPSIVVEPPRINWNDIRLEPILPWPKGIAIPKYGDPGWLDPEDDRIKVAPKIREDWITSPNTYIKFGERVIGADKALDVVLVDQVNRTQSIIRDSMQLNNLIENGADTDNIVLVAPGTGERSLVADDGTIDTGGKLSTGILAERSVNTVVNRKNTMLVGNRGLGANVFSRGHLGGIFNHKAGGSII